VLEEPDEFGDSKRFRRQEEQRFECALQILRCRRSAPWWKRGCEPASDGHATLRKPE